MMDTGSGRNVMFKDTRVLLLPLACFDHPRCRRKYVKGIAAFGLNSHMYYSSSDSEDEPEPGSIRGEPIKRNHASPSAGKPFVTGYGQPHFKSECSRSSRSPVKSELGTVAVKPESGQVSTLNSIGTVKRESEIGISDISAIPSEQNEDTVHLQQKILSACESPAVQVTRDGYINIAPVRDDTVTCHTPMQPADGVTDLGVELECTSDAALSEPDCYSSSDEPDGGDGPSNAGTPDSAGGVQNKECSEADLDSTNGSSASSHSPVNKQGGKRRKRPRPVHGDGEVKPHACDVCDKRFRYKCMMHVHYRTHTGERLFKCSTCGQLFRLKCSLDKHQEVHTGNKTFYICDVCDKPLSSRSNLMTHKQIHTDDYPHAYTICNRRFQRKPYLTNHILTHTQERPYKCKVCGKRVNQQCQLVVHMRVHTGERPFKCGFCKKGFKELAKMHLHERTHTGAKPHVCPHCDKAFADPSAMKRHLLIHTGARPHKCRHCEKDFNDTGARTRHERLHTGDKPYKCGHCERRFHDVGTRSRHEHLHTKVKPFKCEHCDKAFANRQYLTTHIKLMHEKGKLLECDFCGKTFKKRNYLKMHIRNMHKDEMK